eukprot:6872125-Lingulodinium_polyedra.AAC.1
MPPMQRNVRCTHNYRARPPLCPKGNSKVEEDGAEGRKLHARGEGPRQHSKQATAKPRRAPRRGGRHS